MKSKLLCCSLLIFLFACNEKSPPESDPVSIEPKVQQQLELLDSFGQTAVVFGQGEIVTFALSARNVTNENVSLWFASGHQTDFYVRDANNPNTTVWDRNHDSIFTQATTSIDLMPFETKVFQENWNQIQQDGAMLPPGNYVAEATFVGEFDENVSVSFVVR